MSHVPYARTFNHYIAQARADLEGATAMGTSSPSTLAMLFQMVFELAVRDVALRLETDRVHDRARAQP